MSEYLSIFVPESAAQRRELDTFPPLRPLLVFGGGSVNGIPREVQNIRCEATAEIIRHPEKYGQFDVIIPVGGESEIGYEPEGEVMRRTIMAANADIPSDMIIPEVSSIDTQENVEYFYDLQQMFNLSQPGVVSNNFYKDWTELYLQRLGLQAEPFFDACDIVREISPEHAKRVGVFENGEYKQFWRPRVLQAKAIVYAAKVPGLREPLLGLAHKRALRELEAGGR